MKKKSPTEIEDKKQKYLEYQKQYRESHTQETKARIHEEQ